MQTLQSARLTTKPVIAPVTSQQSSITAQAKAYEPLSRPIQRPTGILRHRVPQTSTEEQHHLDADPRFTDLLTKFIASSGLPYEIVNDRNFKELFASIKPTPVIPCAGVVAKAVERLTINNKSLINYQKTVGPLSVTIDVAGNDDEKFLAFSIHYFEDLYERRNVVFLRKLLLSELDADSLLNIMRRALNSFNYANVRFSNIVCPNQEICRLLSSSDVIKRYYVCFYDYVSSFVADLFEIQEFSEGLTQLRSFVRFVKKHPDLYSKFRRTQLSKNAELDMPLIDDGSWYNTSVFLTRCLALHETFTEFSKNFRLTSYITNEKFNHLVHLQRILQQCVKYSRELSHPDNSISQIVPAIMSLRNFITQHTMEYRFEKIIRESFAKSFEAIIHSQQHLRYDIAALLDPRYGFKEHIYPYHIWASFEKKVIEEFVELDETHQKLYYQDIMSMSKDERRILITDELRKYRQIAFVERPEDTENPNHWWGQHQTDMEFLSVMARDYLASPAVAIDASYYFSSGGKFEHVCKLYGYQKLEYCLSLAGSQQEFRGRGASVNTISHMLIETLNATANRLRNVSSDPYTGGMDQIASEREVAELIGLEYPESRNEEDIKDVQKIPLGEEKPSTSSNLLQSAPAPLPVKLISTAAAAKGAPIRIPGAPMRSVQLPVKTIPNPTKFVPLQKKLSPPKPPQQANKEEEKPKDLLLGGDAPATSDDLADKVKLEPVDEEEEDIKPDITTLSVKLAPLKPIKMSVVRPTTSPSTSSSLDRFYVAQKPPPSGSPQLTVRQKNLRLVQQATSSGIIKIPTHGVRVVPRDSVHGPQSIQSHNFVQKFAQKQNFVPKIVVRQAVDIHSRPPIPSGVKGPIQMPKRVAIPVIRGEPKNEFVPPHREMKVETDDMDAYFEYMNTIHREPLTDASAAEAYARHRANVELQKRRACNRRCSVCGHLEVHENLKNVTIDNEKLLIMLGGVYRGEFSMGQAKLFLTKETKTYICHVHFAETMDDIYKMLHVKHFSEIHACPLDVIQNVMLTAIVLRPHILAVQLRKMFIDFCEKTSKAYPHLERPVSLIEYVQPREENDIDDTEIIPKHFRQPRKQVLEADQHDGTIKVIEQEDFKLPTVNSTGAEGCNNPAKCCFCSKIGERGGMLRVPRSEDRLARWVEKLGPEFEARLNSGEENLICRLHFPPEAFSTRGRLLKGMIPDSAPEKVEVTYKIRGNNFLKLDEQKSGTQKNARIDLETGKVGRPKATEEQEDEEYQSDDPTSDSSVQDFLENEDAAPTKRTLKRSAHQMSSSGISEAPVVNSLESDIVKEEPVDPDEPSTSTAPRRSMRRASTVTDEGESADESQQAKRVKLAPAIRRISGRLTKK